MSFALCMALGVLTGPGPLPGAPATGPAAIRQLWASPEDLKPRKRRINAHFWAGNERELYIFYPDLKGLGGGYVGVGSDQCYLFAGWMKARYAWCIDYDEKVVWTHLIHQAFLKKARTPRAYLALWRRKNRTAARQVLERALATDPRRKGVLEVFGKARASIYTRLSRMARRMRAARTPSYVSTQSQYDYVRRAVLARRMRPLLGNLLATRALRGIGRVAQKLGVTVRVLYLSNAEQYWRRYPTAYRRNIRALPYDHRSLVVRTFGRCRTKNLYTYQRQAARQYLEYLAWPAFRRVYQIRNHTVRRRRNVRFNVADPPKRKRRRRRR